MQKLYKKFDILSSYILIGVFLAGLLLLLITLYFVQDEQEAINIGSSISPLLNSILFIILALGIVYCIAGLRLHFVRSKKKNDNPKGRGNVLLVKGIFRISISIVFFIGLSTLMNVFGFNNPKLNSLIIGDQYNPTTGFPVKDLKIVYAQKRIIDGSGVCDIIIQNKNPRYTAANIEITQEGEQNDGISGDKRIKPGGTLAVTIDSDDSANPCKSVSVTNAGIVTHNY